MITIHGSILEFYADMSSPKRHGREPQREKVDLKQILRPEDTELPAAVRDREARKDYVKYLSPAFELADHAAKRPPGSGARLATMHRDGRWLLDHESGIGALAV